MILIVQFPYRFSPSCFHLSAIQLYSSKNLKLIFIRFFVQYCYSFRTLWWYFIFWKYRIIIIVFIIFWCKVLSSRSSGRNFSSRDCVLICLDSYIDIIYNIPGRTRCSTSLTIRGLKNRVGGPFFMFQKLRCFYTIYIHAKDIKAWDHMGLIKVEQ